MKNVFTLLLVLLPLSVFAQEANRNSFGITAGAGSAAVIRASLEGGPGFDLQNNFELGANYYRQIGERLKLETGLFYHYNNLIQKSAGHPDVPPLLTEYDIHLIYLPAFLRYYLSEHFFINGGGLVDIDISNSMALNSSKALSSQSGLGVGLGIGGELAVSPKLYLQLNPYLNIHGVLQVQRESYPGRILDAGIKVGIRTK